MNYMDDGIAFEAKMGDGSAPGEGIMGKLLGAGKRVLTGESLFMTHFTNQGQGKKRVAFAAPYPGKIIPINLAETGRAAFVSEGRLSLRGVGDEGVDCVDEAYWARAFLVEKALSCRSWRGDGMVFIHVGGTVVKKELRGEDYPRGHGVYRGFQQRHRL